MAAGLREEYRRQARAGMKEACACEFAEDCGCVPVLRAAGLRVEYRRQARAGMKEACAR